MNGRLLKKTLSLVYSGNRTLKFVIEMRGEYFMKNLKELLQLLPQRAK